MSGGGNGATTLRQAAAAAHAAQAKTLGGIIRDLRNAYGTSRAELAEQVGITATVIGDTERGRIRVKALRLLAQHPSMEALPRRCADAGVTLDHWIITGETGIGGTGTGTAGSGGTTGLATDSGDQDDGDGKPDGGQGNGGGT